MGHPQLRLLMSDRVAGQGAVAAEHPEQAVDTAFARCRAKMGAPSTRDFSQLSAVLGT